MIRRFTTPSAALAAIAVVVGSLASAAVADEVPFPFDSVDRNTFAVGFVDLSRTTAASLGASAKVIIDQELAKEAAGPLAQLDAMLKPLLDAGAERAYFAVGTPDPQGEMREPVIQVYVRHKAGADRAALVEAAASFDMNDSQVTPIGERWLRLEPPRQETQPGLDEATRAALAAQLAAVESGAVGYTVVMTGAFRELMTKELRSIERRAADRPADQPNFEASVADMMRAMLEMRVARMTVTLGDQPAYHATMAAADAQAAARMLASFDKMRAGMEEAMKRGGGVSEIAMIGMTLNLIKPVQDGPTLAINIETEQLRTFGRDVLVPSIKRAKEAARQAVAMNSIRQILMGAQMYAADHEGKLPDSLAAMAQYVGDLDRLLTHPLTGEKPGFEYVKPAAKLADVANPGGTPMVYELRNGKRHDGGAVGYVDGHVERPPPPDIR